MKKIGNLPKKIEDAGRKIGGKKERGPRRGKSKKNTPRNG